MTAVEVLEALRARGVTLEAAGDRLRYRPSQLVPPDLRAALVAHKPELLRLLTRARPSPAGLDPQLDGSGWPAILPGLGPETIGPFTPCRLCGTGTWVQYGNVPRCLDCARDPGSAAVRLYRRALERWWELTAQGPEANRAAIAETFQAIAKLTDEVGEPWASRLRQQWARAWHREAGICPWCGQAGAYHEPGESA